MTEGATTLTLLALFPLVALVCLTLYLLLKVRGRRSLTASLKGFGIEVRLSTEPTLDQEVKDV